MNDQDSPAASGVTETPSSATRPEPTANTAHLAQGREPRQDVRDDRHDQRRRRRHPRREDAPRRDSSASRQDAYGDASATSINMSELREVVELISQHGFTDFEFEREGFRVRLRKGNEASNIQFLTPPTFAAPPSAQSAAVVPPVAPPTPTLTSQAEAASAQSTAASPSAAPATAADTDLHIITSPIVGTFYRSASPTSEPFVKVGDKIEANTTVCIVEAMKLMNEIPAETSGTIEKIYVENAQPVEYGQPLFGVKKS